MGSSRFTLADAAGICLPGFLAAAQAREDVRRAAEAREAAQARGVAWSGLGPAADRAPRRPLDIRQQAVADAREARRFAEDPRGRFLRCLSELEDQGAPAAADAARAAFRRGFSDQDAPPCPIELASAMQALAGVAGPAADAARQALAELRLAASHFAAE